MSNSRRGLTARQPLGPKRGRADLKHLRAMTEAEIRRTAPPELANLPRDFWKDAKIVLPSRKEVVTMRLDADLLAWFRQQRGYQTRINAILRSYMKAHESDAHPT